MALFGSGGSLFPNEEMNNQREFNQGGSNNSFSRDTDPRFFRENRRAESQVSGLPTNLTNAPARFTQTASPQSSSGGGGVGGGGGGGGGFSGGFQSSLSKGGPSSIGSPGFLNFFEDQLRNRFTSGFGIDPGVLENQRAALTTTNQRNQSGALKQLMAQLNSSGALGGGRGVVLGKQLADSFGENILNQLAQFDLGSNQAFLQDRQAAFGEGNQFSNTLANRQVGLQQSASQDFATRMRNQLGMAQIKSSEGIAGNSLGVQRQGQQFNQGLQTFLTNLGLTGNAR